MNSDEKKKKKKKNLPSNIREQDGKKLDGPLVGYHAFIHHFISSRTVCFSSFFRQRRYSSKFAWNPLFSTQFGYIAIREMHSEEPLV